MQKTLLLGDSKQNIQRLLYEFDRVCERRKLKANVGKSQRGEPMNLGLKGEVPVNVFK